MGQDPDRIRQDIEETRSHMDETVDAIGYKADVKSRVKESLGDKKDAAMGKVTGAADAVVSTVGGAVPDGESVKRGVRRTAGVAQENPLGLAVAGAAVGLLVGLVAPSSRAEDERMGSLADDVKDRAAQARTEAVERGKLVGEEAAASLTETVKESGREQGEDLAESVKESAQEVASRSS